MNGNLLTSYPLRAKSRGSSQGYTLIELLTVIVIVSLLAYFCVPAFGSLNGARAVNEGIYQVSSVLQLARSEAVSRQTYVWVGFSQSAVNGCPVLTIYAASSKDGSSDSSQGNLRGIVRPIHVLGLTMTNWSGLKSATTAAFAQGTPVSVGGSGTLGVIFPTQSATIVNTVTFTPRGEAMRLLTPGPDDPYDALLDVSFRQSNTATPAANANDAGVVITGSTGTVQTVRLQ